MTWALLTIAWIACGVLGFGITLADFQHRFPLIASIEFRMDVRFATFVAVCGPLGLVVALTCSGFASHGLMYRRQKI